MDLEIKEEPNDTLIVKLLGITDLVVYFDNAQAQFASEGALLPTGALVMVNSRRSVHSQEPESQKRLTEAACQWTADKLGLDITDVAVQDS